MGRRSRTRAKGDGVTVARTPSRPPRPTTPRVRKILTIQLGLVVALCVLVLVGIAGLGGRIGPFIVVFVAAMSSALIVHWSRTKLADEPLNDEDRLLQTVAGGLMIMAVVFSLLSAILVTVT